MDRKTIKKNVTLKNVTIVLYDYDTSDKPLESLSNIECLDSLGNLLWIIEKPVTHFEAYYDMWMDSVSNRLIAVTGSGFRHEIDIHTGKILKSYLVK